MRCPVAVKLQSVALHNMICLLCSSLRIYLYWATYRDCVVKTLPSLICYYCTSIVSNVAVRRSV